MSIRRFALATIAAVALCVAPAMAAEQDFTLHNNSGHTIKSLYVSPNSQDHWGPDILGQDILNAGESVDVHFDRDESECQWDVRVEFTDGTDGEVRDVNFCSVSTVNVT